MSAETTPAPRTGAWSSGVSTNEFAAAARAGMQPLGFVQGCSVVSWSFLGQGFSPLGGLSMGQRPNGYFEQYPCPHGIVSAHHPEMSSFELSLSGTAVHIPGAALPSQPFTT